MTPSPLKRSIQIWETTLEMSLKYNCLWHRRLYSLNIIKHGRCSSFMTSVAGDFLESLTSSQSIPLLLLEIILRSGSRNDIFISTFQSRGSYCVCLLCIFGRGQKWTCLRFILVERRRQVRLPERSTGSIGSAMARHKMRILDSEWEDHSLEAVLYCIYISGHHSIISWFCTLSSSFTLILRMEEQTSLVGHERG